MSDCSFENSIKTLEKIVSDLEAANIPIEQQLKLFEAGVSLSRDCLKKLDEVEQKVEKIMAQSNGELSTKPFEESNS